MIEGSHQPLPIVGQPPAERADAARNREKVLDAALRLIDRNGAASLSLDEVAREACVGVGTVYRRFGDRAGLVSAVVNEREVQFQAAFLGGPPPLGPGAPPADRIRAFLHALLDRQEEQWELMLLRSTSTKAEHYASAPHRANAFHLTTLLRELDPALDAEFLAEALLSPLEPALLNYQRRTLGYSIGRLRAGLDDLLNGVRSAPPGDDQQ